jgi:hypothetical protein
MVARRIAVRWMKQESNWARLRYVSGASDGLRHTAKLSKEMYDCYDWPHRVPQPVGAMHSRTPLDPHAGTSVKGEKGTREAEGKSITQESF